MSAGTTLKKYIGVAGEALASAWQIYRGPGSEAPPVGSQNRFPTTYPGGMPVGTSTRGGGTIAGISTGTILLGVVAYFLLRK